MGEGRSQRERRARDAGWGEGGRPGQKCLGGHGTTQCTCRPRASGQQGTVDVFKTQSCPQPVRVFTVTRGCTCSATGAPAGSGVRFCTSPTRTIRGLLSCSAAASKAYPCSSKSPSEASSKALLGRSSLLNGQKRSVAMTCRRPAELEVPAAPQACSSQRSGAASWQKADGAVQGQTQHGPGGAGRLAGQEQTTLSAAFSPWEASARQPRSGPARGEAGWGVGDSSGDDVLEMLKCGEGVKSQ